MEQIVVKSEPEELVDDYKGDILMNYADQEMSSTSAIPMNIEQIYIKQEIKEEFKTEDEMLLNEGTYSEVVNKEILAKIDFPKTEKEFQEEVNEEKLYKCDDCPKKYKTGGGLKEHKRHVHNKGEQVQYKCCKCGYQTARRGHLNYHLKIHDKDKYLKCRFCQYMAAGSQTLNAHLISKHRLENEGENKIKITSKIHECPKCSYSTVRKNDYNNHIKACLKLKNVKWHKCDLCHFRTITISNLNTHIKTHNKIKELKCLFCSYQCNLKQNLDNHILIKHFDLLNESNQNLITSKVHCCQHCNYKTTNTSDLKKHLSRKH